MDPRISFVTLGVRDLDRAIQFYEQVLKLTRLPTPPTVAFFEMGRTWLALYPRDLLAAELGLRKSQIELLSGDASPSKRFLLRSIDLGDIRHRLLALLR